MAVVSPTSQPKVFYYSLKNSATVCDLTVPVPRLYREEEGDAINVCYDAGQCRLNSHYEVVQDNSLSAFLFALLFLLYA